jgi:hypothetical protein
MDTKLFGKAVILSLVTTARFEKTTSEEFLRLAKHLYGEKASLANLTSSRSSIRADILVQLPQLNAYRFVRSKTFHLTDKWKQEILSLFPDEMPLMPKEEWMAKVCDYKEPPFQKGVIDGKDLSWMWIN